MPTGFVALTSPTRAVLEALVADPTRARHGADLIAESGLSGGTMYPVLARLEAVQWLDSAWEPPTEHIQGWPRRRWYRLSTDGVALARGALASGRADAAAPIIPRPRVAGAAT